ncbi:POK18 protein, partial [Gymnorhina tibicen]|nr:POK18 protein [Gymnorhina tibicen]
WKYLGMTITSTQIWPQKLSISRNIHTLQDVQKLVGDIQWVRNLYGITNEDMKPLFELLKDGQRPQDP